MVFKGLSFGKNLIKNSWHKLKYTSKEQVYPQIWNKNGSNGNLEFSWWSWQRCLQGNLWIVNILFYLFYSCFAICLLQVPWFCCFLAAKQVQDWHRSVMFLMNHTLPFSWIRFFLSESIIKKGPTCNFSLHIKQNSTEWAAICCSRYISKIHINF